ncbi:MAG: hypothetical protein ACRDZ8_16155 [Acidimicrobiales bacterium]
MPNQRRAPNKRPPRPPTKKTSPEGIEPAVATTSTGGATSDANVASTATAVDKNEVGTGTGNGVEPAGAGTGNGVGAAEADAGTAAELDAIDDLGEGDSATLGEAPDIHEAPGNGGPAAAEPDAADSPNNGGAVSGDRGEVADDVPAAAPEGSHGSDAVLETPATPNTPAAAAGTGVGGAPAAAAGAARASTSSATDKPRQTKTISPTSKALFSANRPVAAAAKAGTPKEGQSGATGKAGTKTNGAPAEGSPAKAAGAGTAKKTPSTPTKSGAAGKSAATTGKGGSSASAKSPASPRPKTSTSSPVYRPPTGQTRNASRRPPPKRKKRRFTKKTISAAVGLVLVAAIVVFFALAVNGSGTGTTSSTNQGETGPESIPIPNGPVLAAPAAATYGQPIDGIQCQTTEQLAYHIHVHLTIFVDGKPQQVPYAIGIAPPVHTSTQNGGAFVDGGGCYYWMHTHAADGIVHIESPSSTIYNLGTFFDVWGQPLKSDQVGPAVGKVTVYQNGKLYTGDPRAVQLTAHNQIQLDVGTNTPAQPLLTSWGSL